MHKNNSTPFIDFELEGDVALVTGSCGQLGFQFCKTLGLAGAEVIVSDIKKDLCQKQVAELKKLGIKASYVLMNVANEKSVKKAFQTVEKENKHLDILINAAAIAVFTPFEERTFKEFMRVLQVNIGGVFLASQGAAKIMKKQKSGGRIINIASVYGIVSSDPRIYTDCARLNSEVYSASKAAVISLTKYLAVHLAPYKIRVNAISPGGIYRDQGEDFLKRYSRRTPMNRMGNEEEINHSVLYLASKASSYVAGHNLVVDGGFTAW